MTEEEKTIDGMKRNIEEQLREYEQAIAAAKVWYRQWQAKRGFRCVQAQLNEEGN